MQVNFSSLIQGNKQGWRQYVESGQSTKKRVVKEGLEKIVKPKKTASNEAVLVSQVKLVLEGML